MDKKNNRYLEDINFSPIFNTNSTIVIDGEEKDSPFGKIYGCDMYRKIFKNTNFYPNLKDSDKNYYNEFQGFGYEKILPYDVDKKEVLKRQQKNLDFYLGFLKKYVCNGEEEILNYFMSLLSFYIKYPHLLNHIILVLYSNEQGTGKSSFLDFLMRVVGIIYGANTEMEQVLDKHSNLSYKKIINVIEELEYDKSKNNAKKLKNKCQAETSILNEKNEPMRTILNFVHYIITTNEYRSIPLEPNDRRHFILEFKKIYDNDGLVNRVDDLYANDEFIYTFGNYLKNLEEQFDFMRIINWEKKRPMTELFRIMIRKDTIDRFFTKLVRYEYHNDNNINCDENYNYYVRDVLGRFVIHNNNLVIKKWELFELYENKTDNDIKNKKDSFYTNIIDIKKLVKQVEIEEEVYLEFNISKIKNHLKLNDGEVKIIDIVKKMLDEKLPMKIKLSEINNILKR